MSARVVLHEFFLIPGREPAVWQSRQCRLGLSRKRLKLDEEGCNRPLDRGCWLWAKKWRMLCRDRDKNQVAAERTRDDEQ